MMFPYSMGVIIRAERSVWQLQLLFFMHLEHHILQVQLAVGGLDVWLYVLLMSSGTPLWCVTIPSPSLSAGVALDAD